MIMHIPDGYLNPATSGVMFAAMLPVWAIASKRVKKTIKAKQVPLLAIGASFSFVIMMFNIPIPCGSTGHAVGSVLVAILLGPWAACLAVTVALVVQALVFGDGGITAIGANCFNTAFVEVFAGYCIYRLISTGAGITSGRRVIAAGIAGYLGINLAAFSAAVMFGIQPILSHTADGQSLYCPYGLKSSITAMMSTHLLVFGWVEAIVTSLVVKYLQKMDKSLLQDENSQ